MPIFSDVEKFYDTIGALLDKASRDSSVGPKIAKSGLIIQFRYTEPDAVTTVDATTKDLEDGQYVKVVHGETDLKPDIMMSMKADVSHAFWSGKVNLMSAITKKDIVVKGSLPKVLKLLPAVTPLYKEYPKLLEEKGYGDMVMK
jgi:putative sterol carrier protein